MSEQRFGAMEPFFVVTTHWTAVKAVAPNVVQTVVGRPMRQIARGRLQVYTHLEGL